MIDLDRFKRWMSFRNLFLKLVLPLKFPLILNIEPTNRCNLACKMCARSLSKRKLVDMDWKLFEQLCEEVGKNGPIFRVFLQKDGEPLLYKRIAEMVAALNSVNAAKTIGIITNGSMLSEEMFIGLAKAGLGDLIVSIDAIDEEGYFKLKGVNLFRKVVANVEKAVEIKRKNRWNLPKIKVRMVARKGYEEEIKLFKQYWYNRADMIDITPYHTWIGSVPDERNYSVSPRYACSLLWYTGVINSDGNVSPCCIDYDQKGVIGKIDTGGFSEIWNGKSLKKLRYLHLIEKYSQTPICGPCEYWQIKENIHSWLKRKYKITQ